jgi:iron complex outermembrane receptor protein
MKANTLLVILFITFSSVKSQTIIRGKIIDEETKEALIGATILVKNTSKGTITNTNGEFQLNYSGAFPVLLEARYISYVTQEVTVEKDKELLIKLKSSDATKNEVTVTARRRNEQVQNIPIPTAVIGSRDIDNNVAFNVNRVKEVVPSVQLYSSNPRNTTLNIRGLGSTFGLTNDGIDPGVGFYVDGVYYARAAATTIDFIDVQQIEVLRGPQGMLFGKNTTAGTFNITSRKPSFETSAILEQSFGNFSFVQTKASISGGLYKSKIAGRLSFTGTNRNGVLQNVRTENYTNTLNNQGIRGQILFTPNEKVKFLLIGDYTQQRPDGYAQVVAGVAPTLRPEFRQFESIINDLNYALPSQNPFDRKIDHDTPWRSNQDMGGISLNGDILIGKGTLTTTTAWRHWKWGPSNDRDFTGLQALALSQAPSIHNQLSQEIRYAGDFNKKLSGVIGLFGFFQKLDPDGAHVEESGKDQWRFVMNNQNPLWQTPGLLDGYGIRTYPRFKNFSGALFGQLDWKVTDKLVILPGARLNYDQKYVDFKRETYGGLQTTDPALLALQRSVYSNQQFTANVEDWNLSGQLTAFYKINEKIRTFATMSTGFKPVGLNLGGLPTQNGLPMTELAVIRPEQVLHYELGMKSELIKNLVFNATAFRTDIKDFQTVVQVAELGVNRGYLSNAEQVRSQGAELELAYNIPGKARFFSSMSFTDARYISFTNAPVPLEETGGTANFKDISGEQIPGVSKYAIAGGFEGFNKIKIGGKDAQLFYGADAFYRSGFSSNPTPSKYLNIEGYTLVNARIGIRTNSGITVLLWSRNLMNINYFEQLMPGAGNIGHFAGVLGDPRTYGLTIRYNLN